MSDTGVGISPDDLPRIWDEFSQVRAGGGDPERGLGIGLAVVRRLSGIRGHPVDVRSTPGIGSTFAVTVPLAEAAPAAGGAATVPDPAPRDARPAPAPAPAPEGCLVVLVEDDQMIRTALALLLSSRGYATIEADTVGGAVEAVARDGRVPGAVVADYKLRGDGLGSEAIRLIRERVGAPVPAILLTGDVRPEAIESADSLGARMLRKPVTPGQLLESLADLLRGA